MDQRELALTVDGGQVVALLPGRSDGLLSDDRDPSVNVSLEPDCCGYSTLRDTTATTRGDKRVCLWPQSLWARHTQPLC